LSELPALIAGIGHHGDRLEPLLRQRDPVRLDHRRLLRHHHGDDDRFWRYQPEGLETQGAISLGDAVTDRSE
jgi:hypothetical protein